MTEPLVLLHGFAGTRRSWDQVAAQLTSARYRPVAIDLPGHGDDAATAPSFPAAVQAALAAVPGSFALCGYSMGGRIALQAALAAPERVTRLVLVSTTAGIADAGERQQRREADEDLARFCETATAEQFADRWQAVELFAGTSPDAARLWREDLLRNHPRALAQALTAMGTGAMQPLWERLGELTMPATVVVGERDARYVGLGQRLVAAMPAAKLVKIAGAGHGIPREAPRQLAAVIEERDEGEDQA